MLLTRRRKAAYRPFTLGWASPRVYRKPGRRQIWIIDFSRGGSARR